MANTSHEHMTVQGGNFAIILPVTVTAGEVASVGTAILHEALESTEISFSNAASKTEYMSKTLDNGVTVEMEKVSKVLDAKTGSQKSGSGTDGDKISITTLEVDKAALAELRSLSTAFVLVPLGESTAGASQGYAIMYGKLNGAVTRGTKGSEFVAVKAEFIGTTGVAATGFTVTNLNATTAFGIGVDPMGGAAISSVVTTLTSGNLTDLLAGKIVLVDA